MENYRKTYMDYYSTDFGKDMIIHHIDENRENNEISNLILMPNDLHSKWHAAKNEWNRHEEMNCLNSIFSLKNTHYPVAVEMLEKYISLRNELQCWVNYKQLLDYKKRLA